MSGTLYKGGLTSDGERERRLNNAAAKTFAGMASFGGAKKGKTCRECVFFVLEAPNPHRAADNQLKDGRCAKAARMMMRRLELMPKFPPIANACKHFALNTEAPPLYKSGGKSHPPDTAARRTR